MNTQNKYEKYPPPLTSKYMDEMFSTNSQINQLSDKFNTTIQINDGVLGDGIVFKEIWYDLEEDNQINGMGMNKELDKEISKIMDDDFDFVSGGSGFGQRDYQYVKKEHYQKFMDTDFEKLYDDLKKIEEEGV